MPNDPASINLRFLQSLLFSFAAFGRLFDLSAVVRRVGRGGSVRCHIYGEKSSQCSNFFGVVWIIREIGELIGIGFRVVEFGKFVGVLNKSVAFS